MFKIKIRDFEFDESNLELVRTREVLCPDMKAVGEKLKRYNHQFYSRRWPQQHWSLDALLDAESDGALHIATLEREDGSEVCADDPEMDEIGLRTEVFDGYRHYISESK